MLRLTNRCKETSVLFSRNITIDIIDGKTKISDIPPQDSNEISKKHNYPYDEVSFRPLKIRDPGISSGFVKTGKNKSVVT